MRLIKVDRWVGKIKCLFMLFNLRMKKYYPKGAHRPFGHDAL